MQREPLIGSAVGIPIGREGLFCPMKTLTLRTPIALAAIALTALAPGQLRAQVFVETADAGATLTTATTAAGNGGSLLEIDGSISDAFDVDIFKLQIVDPLHFSATTVNATTSMDTQLYLFDSTGHAVVGNDDASFFTLQSSIAAGSLALTSDVYYLAVSLSGNNPINSSSQLLFTPYTANTTVVLTPSASTSLTTLSGFDGGTYFSESGSYAINLTGVASIASAVPEVSATSLALGFLALTSALWVRRRLATA